MFITKIIFIYSVLFGKNAFVYIDTATCCNKIIFTCKEDLLIDNKNKLGRKRYE